MILQIALEAATVCIGLYLAFGKSYFQEKGKNIATKEDIQDITGKIEKIKSEVGILTHKKISLSTEKQNCLLDFYAKLSIWINYVVDIDLIHDNELYDTYYQRVYELMQVSYHNYLSAESKVDVFFNMDEELLEAKKALRMPMTNLENALKISLLSMKSECSIYNIIYNSPDVLPDNSKKLADMNAINDKQVEILNGYLSKRNEMYKNIASLNFQLLKILSSRVTNLV